MNNLEILNKTEIIIRESTGHPLSFLFGTFALAVVLFIVAEIIYRVTYKGVIAGIAYVLISLVLFGGICLSLKESFKTKEIPTGRYRYTVIIEDTETLKNVYENYNIVGSKGIIYIFEDKEPETTNY